jgi:uracil-DNA glycosylase
MMNKNMILAKSWMKYLGEEFDKDYMVKLFEFLKKEAGEKKNVYPGESQIFEAFNLTPLDEVKVVIIGQDPYHGPGQAHGLCFSVKAGIKIPPSLRNIYKELGADLDLEIPDHGFLESWAKNGVLMLNNVLTVQEAMPASHKGRGWEVFTDKVVEVLNLECENLVFLLWGNHAQKKAVNVDRNRHLVLECSHPSPFSAYKGFLGSGCFSKSNEYLRGCGKMMIDWSL